MNEFTLLFLLFLVASVMVQAWLGYRHMRHINSHRNTVPSPFVDNIPLPDHQKAADYTCAKVKTNLFELLLGAVLILIWTLGGGLQWLDLAWRALDWPELWTGTAFIVSATIIGALLDLPVSVYRTFGLEQRFGFNKMSARLFAIDALKNTLLGLLMGVPLLALVLWIMAAAGGWWWLYAWLVWLGFSAFMLWAYPGFIAPLFNKFRPLQNAELQARIEALLARNGFSSNGIFVMDGSTRSTHGNAYFTGLGANKRIVFFDTLMDELTHDEIEAVLAHELGHFKCHHVYKRVGVLAALSLLSLALLAWLLESPWFYQGLGVTGTPGSNYMALMLFVLISPAFSFILQPVFSFMSRRHEFEADDFAAAQVRARDLITALVGLYKENANTLTPDPMYSAFYDSHPPAPVRIAHLGAGA